MSPHWLARHRKCYRRAAHTSGATKRLAGKGGEPVIQLQTAFGGGKTHTLLAVYHLATRKCALSELPGVRAVLDQAGLGEVPQARVAVLDGSARAPGQAWKRENQQIKTLWGDLAWQLGGIEAFSLIKDADLTDTCGKEVLRDLLERHAPCVVLIDELVAYVRQFRTKLWSEPGDRRETEELIAGLEKRLQFLQEHPDQGDPP
jgi:predicted AAA+ superfamily ATPase